MKKLLALLFVVTFFSLSNAAEIEYFPKDNAMMQFGVEHLASALEKTDLEKVRIVLLPKGESNIEPEGFRIVGKDKKWEICATDFAGAMYGTLEMAEQLITEGKVTECLMNPYLKKRGVKFNLPLDMRTPTYSEPSDAVQKNIPEIWDFEFWKETIDHLARHRYNHISLWSLHPFPSMVKVPEYPEIALDDVQRSTCDWEEHYSGRGDGFDSPEILEKFETVKKMTIDEKIAFWKKVMAYGKKRNVDFYIITWNIFVYGTDGKYGLTDKYDNEKTRDYFRCSVRELISTYPNLAGVGLTTGENMQNINTKKKEHWAFATYGQGVLDALKKEPEREIVFIHRQHQASVGDILKEFKPLVDNPQVDFVFSFKYAKAHVYSCTEQAWHGPIVEMLRKNKPLKTTWTLRNDDVYYFRWGAPDFVREFVKNIPHNVSWGYYYGCDQWLPGREFLAKEPSEPRLLEVEKHWMQWLLWGRLGYDPKLTNERLTGLIAAKFGLSQDGAKILFDAWQAASMVYPITTGFHWENYDFQWYIEGCRSRPHIAKTESGFHDVNKFISCKTHPSTDNITIPDFVKGKKKGTTPYQIAEQLNLTTDNALALLKKLKKGDHPELNATLDDIEIVAMLGKYYARKIAGSTSVALFRKTKDEKYSKQAKKELTEALEYWKEYTLLASARYKNPLWTNRVGHVDWEKTTAEVERDIDFASPSSLTKQ